MQQLAPSPSSLLFSDPIWTRSPRPEKLLLKDPDPKSLIFIFAFSVHINYVYITDPDDASREVKVVKRGEGGGVGVLFRSICIKKILLIS